MKAQTLVYLQKQIKHSIFLFIREFATPPYDALNKLIKNFNSGSKPPEILFFGDSVLERISDKDTNKRNLAKMVTKILSPHFRVVTISRRSYHPRLYYRLVRALEVMRNYPTLLILPVNIRSFSPQWDLRPFWQYTEEMNALEEFIANPSQGAVKVKQRLKKEITNSEMDDFRASPVNYLLSPLKTVGEFLDIIDSKPSTEEEKLFRKKQILIFHYMHPLVKEHRNLAALEEMLRLLQKMKIKVLLYMTPINVEAGDHFVGKEFRDQVQANVRLVSELVAPFVTNGNIRYADWSFKMAAEYFFYDGLATEHLNQTGRLLLAQWIKSEVSAFGIENNS